MCTTLLYILCFTDSGVSTGCDDNVPGPANEVTETNNNKNEAEPVSNADNDKKKNGTSSSIAEARENYKFDVSLSSVGAQ